MCLAVPMKVKSIRDEFAIAQSGSFERKVNIQMLSGLRTGDYILVHAGFAIQKLDPKKARETLKMLDAIH